MPSHSRLHAEMLEVTSRILIFSLEVTYQDARSYIPKLRFIHSRLHAEIITIPLDDNAETFHFILDDNAEIKIFLKTF